MNEDPKKVQGEKESTNNENSLDHTWSFNDDDIQANRSDEFGEQIEKPEGKGNIANREGEDSFGERIGDRNADMGGPIPSGEAADLEGRKNDERSFLQKAEDKVTDFLNKNK